MPVHFAGYPCDMPRIHHLARKNKIIIIEDAAHALGAKYQQKGQWIKVGSCLHSDMTTFSFHPVKSITCGEGGVITTNSKELYESLKRLRSHGIEKNNKTNKIGPWYYEMKELGFNYRITDMQCALGLSQLQKINRFVQRRKTIVAKYNAVFQSLPNVVPLQQNGQAMSAEHIYVLRIDFDRLRINRKKFMSDMRNKGVGSQVHYIPVYKHPFYQTRFQFKDTDFPNTERFYKECLSLPLYPSMTEKEVKRVISTIKHMVESRTS
jgi:dTDP-4-amino-4,6-dideoxygalactose transaminase